MKKALIINSVVLIALAMATVGCSSKSNNATTTTAAAAKGSSGHSVSSSNVNPVEEAALKADINTIKSTVATSCATVKSAYADFNSPGNSTDGYTEVSSISDSFTTLADDLDAAVDSTRWPTVGKNKDYYDNNYLPFTDKLRSYADSLSQVTIGEAAGSQTADQVQQIHTIMTDFQTYMSTSEYGPCEVGA